MAPVFNMKSNTVLTASFLLLVLSICIAAQSKSDRETAGLFGPVRSVQSKTIDLSRTTDGDFVTYDREGREMSREPVSDYGEPMGKMVQSFDALGLRAESTWTDPKGKVVGKEVYNYKDGKLILHLTYNGAGTLVEKTVRSYDAGGRVDADIYHTPDDKAVAKTIYKYDKGSDPIEVAFFRADGRKATAPVGPCLGAHRVTYTYNDNGKVSTRAVFEDDGRLKKSYRYAYDDKGNTTEYVSGDDYSTTTFVYKYEFDAKGNWIKKTAESTTKAGKPLFSGESSKPYIRTTVTTREIIYY
jgi:hypothetical protein